MSEQFSGSADSTVYVLTRRDKSGAHPLSKIGFTTKSAEKRASNYTDGNWEVADDHPMPSWLGKLVEKRAHEILEDDWLDPSSVDGSALEVFRCDSRKASNAIMRAQEECQRIELSKLGVSPAIHDLIRGIE